MKANPIFKLLALALLLAFLGCSKSDNDIDDLQTNNKFFAKVNGTNFVSGDPYIGASYRADDGDGINVLSIIAADVENVNFGKAIGITFSVIDDNFELKDGLVLTQNSPNVFLLLGSYTESSDTDEEFIENTSIRLEITKVNKTNKQVSGNFNFIAVVEDAFGSEKTYTVTDGVFNNISYTED
ncbi:hypothetical protein [Tamlana crocina]|uniref:Uncharacterized protein n=1 Tax=Tamlana crocina TaxID=393006 RepID=A0ABX1DBS1_9FLAO|nr:hypothetical protein [Tamlana crocina]NJX15804.1 hypothetical protein [Tamlana crocina]